MKADVARYDLQEKLRRIRPEASELTPEEVAWLTRFVLSPKCGDLLESLIAEDGLDASNAVLNLFAVKAEGEAGMLTALVRCHLSNMGSESAEYLNFLEVFGGSFALDAADYVTGGLPEAHMDAFLTRRLVICLIENEQVRYSLDPAVRPALQVLFTIESRDEALFRFQFWYSNLVASVRSRLQRSPDKATLKLLDTEAPNLEQVLKNRQVDLGFVVSLWRWWYHKGDYQAGVTALKNVVIAADMNDPFRAEAYRALGFMLHLLGQTSEGERYLRFAVVRAKGENRLSLMADALNDLGEVAMMDNRYEEARERHEQAAQIAVIAKDLWAQGSAENGIGMHYYLQGDCIRAHRHFTTAAKIYERSKDVFTYAKILANVALVLKDRQQYEAASTNFLRCCEIFEGYGDRGSYLQALFGVADCAIYLAKYDEAQKHFLTVLELITECGYSKATWMVCANLAVVAFHMGEYKRAVTLFSAVDAMRSDGGAHVPVSPEAQKEFDEVKSLARSRMRSDLLKCATETGRRLSVADIMRLYER